MLSPSVPRKSMLRHQKDSNTVMKSTFQNTKNPTKPRNNNNFLIGLGPNGASGTDLVMAMYNEQQIYVMNILTNNICAGWIGVLKFLSVTNNLQVVTIIEFKIVIVTIETIQCLA